MIPLLLSLEDCTFLICTKKRASSGHYRLEAHASFLNFEIRAKSATPSTALKEKIAATNRAILSA